MKFERVGPSGDSVRFDLDRQEREIFISLLQCYPVLDPSYHQLSRPEHREALATEQALLTEQLTEAQQSNRRRLEEFIRTRLKLPDDNSKTVPSLLMTLSEVDWLLQIVNDIRVGCWVRLGRPETDQFQALVASGGVADFTMMELGGLVEMVLLDALKSGS